MSHQAQMFSMPVFLLFKVKLRPKTIKVNALSSCPIPLKNRLTSQTICSPYRSRCGSTNLLQTSAVSTLSSKVEERRRELTQLLGLTWVQVPCIHHQRSSLHRAYAVLIPRHPNTSPHPSYISWCECGQDLASLFWLDILDQQPKFSLECSWQHFETVFTTHVFQSQIENHVSFVVQVTFWKVVSFIYKSSILESFSYTSLTFHPNKFVK